MSELSKLQIRAKVLSALSEIKADDRFSADLLSDYVSTLAEIEDRKALFDIVLKEIIKMSEEEVSFTSCLVKELVPKDYVEEAIFDVLKMSSYSDETKYKLVQMLRIVGSSSAVNQVPQYFDNPQELIDIETEKMIKRASFNPETMLDFLDFIYAVSDNDKSLLLDSLKDDYTGDNLANLIYPILYSDFSDDIKLQVVEILPETKSALALSPFEYILKVSENKKLIAAVELGLKKLKLAGATEEKVNQFYKEVLNNSKSFEFYTTVPDGAGNQALLSSILNKNNKVNFIAVVINDLVGVVDCFGFYDISQDETSRIIAKFYQSEGKYKVSDEYVKYRLIQAIQTTIDNKNFFPYEFICWYSLLSYIQPLSCDVDTFIDSFQIDKQIDKAEIVNLLAKDYTYRWFISSSESCSLQKIIDDIYDLNIIDEDVIDKILIESVNKVFDSQKENIWKNRIKQLIYLLNENSLKKDANLFFNVLQNDEFFTLFKQVILQRSIFNNLLLLSENVKKSSLPVNIFKKKIVSEEKYNIKKIEKIIIELKKYWINE